LRRNVRCPPPKPSAGSTSRWSWKWSSGERSAARVPGRCSWTPRRTTNHRDPKNLGVVVTEDGRAKFSAAGIDDPTAHYKGKTIRVRGVVIRRDDRPYIEVNEPGQIELVS
jgi:hypothetical protein